MIDALVVSRFQTATGANPGLFIEYLDFGLNTGDEKHIYTAYANEPHF